MSIKDTLKKLAGSKTQTEKERELTGKEKVKEFAKSLIFALIAALFIITFIVQNTRIPTGSMEDTIEVGDFVIVNKFIYGARSPKYLPFTDIEIPYFNLPALASPKRNDIVVFEFPGARDRIRAEKPGVNYVKRCIGIPGDTVVIVNRIVYVNGKQFPIPPHIRYSSLSSIPPGQVNTALFPKGMNWNTDNYGPLIVPKKGYTIKLDADNIEQWETTIDREFGRKAVNIINGAVTINEKPVSSYTFKKDYYFMMGDNRDESWDSRYWGFVPRDMVVGEAFLVLFSWDRDIPFTDPFGLIGSIRPSRILMLLH